jgi:hypothetical protein
MPRPLHGGGIINGNVMGLEIKNESVLFNGNLKSSNNFVPYI